MNQSKTILAGTKAVALTLALFIVLIGLNILVGLLPKRFTSFDLTANKLYTMSDTTKTFLKNLDKDVTVYVLCEDSDPSVIMQPFLDQYGSYPKIHVTIMDPKQHPDFVKNYTENELSNFSLIIESDLRHTYIDYYDFLYYHHSQMGSIPYKQYQELISNEYYVYAYQYSYGINLLDATMYFDGENILSSAIEYVSVPVIPHAFLLTTHGETAFSGNLATYLDSLNFETEEVNLKTSAPDVLDNCSVLIINNPQTDLSADELSTLLSYVDKGGNILFLTNPGKVNELPNFSELALRYGLKAKEGIIYEDADSYHATSAVFDIYPIPLSGTSESPVYAINYLPSNRNYMLCFPQAHAIEAVTEDAPSDVTLYILDQSSPSSHLQSGDAILDETGSYAVGYAAETAQGARFVWYSCADAFTDEGAQNSSFGNYVFFATTLSYLSKSYVSGLATIYPVSLAESVLTISQANTTLWIVFAIVLIPLTILAVGIIIFYLRKKK